MERLILLASWFVLALPAISSMMHLAISVVLCNTNAAACQLPSSRQKKKKISIQTANTILKI
jgi:hypothetical protein